MSTECQLPPKSIRRSRSICVTKYVNKQSPTRRTSLGANHQNQILGLVGTSSTTQACLLKVLEEELVLSTLTSSPPILRKLKKEQDYEQPMKVFRRITTCTPDPLNNITATSKVPKLQNHVSSCQALKNAVSTLYNMDDFELTKIGEGFFSEVFKVTHKIDQKIMVLKRNKHRANRSSMLKEVQLMNTLNHENILKYEGACVHEGQLHALTEYANGGSLDQMIQTGSLMTTGEFPWSDRITLANDINEGLSYLHMKKIFHRDLTSKNILIRISDITNAIRAVVADFGLATRIPNSDDEKLPQVGSPYWMSPECLRGQYYDQRSDTFSYGIILCEIIARVNADPDFLPRTENFGVDYLGFSRLVNEECPIELLKLAFTCVRIDPFCRPTISVIKSTFQQNIFSQLPKLTDKEEIKLVTRKMNGMKLPKSEKAKIYQNSPYYAIGEEMARLDPHYVPSPNQGINPFLPLFGSTKIMGNFFWSCIEFNKSQSIRPVYRKTVSMMGQEPPSLENLQQN